MNEKFRSRKSNGFGVLLTFISLLIIVLFFGIPLISGDLIGIRGLLIKCLITIAIIGLFIWIWTSTFYTINGENLVIKSGPLRWLISIKDIKTIRLDQNTIGGLIKPTLSWTCIEIDYMKYKSISISPENQDRFVATLRGINKKIEIKN